MKKVKDWIGLEKAQFKVIKNNGTFFTEVIRLKDNEHFIDSGTFIYKGRKAYVLDFMSDYITVHLEVRKEWVIVLPGNEFDEENYEEIYVPINDIIKTIRNSY